ncbi:ATP-binding protein [Undibacterium cyanobacteriorum]|uniref:histidine kinase n=1 Tax=Undibacterium cyanobacteriorum TaxID=3073561 RepID=A0ABY9RF76_9BURK|nr:ATP-binding protein [Undibacterium sp. 20NA77.5]WMW79882.1 ATP-binding protein [Undibacterium sp. 20NA77.5]
MIRSSLNFASQAPIQISASFWRSLQTFNVSRVLIALILITYLSVKSSRDVWQFDQASLLGITATYLVLSIGFVILKARWTKRFMLQLVMQVSIDLIIISTLYVGAGGSKSGLVILYLFPLAGAGILGSLLVALSFVSAVSLFLLFVNAYQVLQSEDSHLISQAGLYGASYFAVVYVLNRLARNLIGQEELARKRGFELSLQQSMNRTIIADMDDGVLVLDQNGNVFEANPAAERLLGLEHHEYASTGPLRIRDISYLSPIVDEMDKWKAGHDPHTTAWLRNEGASFVVLRHQNRINSSEESYAEEAPDTGTHLKLRFVSIDEDAMENNDGLTTPRTIVFIQNVSDIENQAQQLKLASMGRLTASIAHEVRNPLSSISYATSLMSEDVHNEAQSRRLLKIVEDNVTRLNKLIEDILKLSRKAQANLEPVYLVNALEEIVQEFVETRGIAPDTILLQDDGHFYVRFDPDHLHEVITNLLSNAVRYASGKAHCIRLVMKISSSGRRELHIQDDGPGISATVRSHLFEPFYTTSSKGTGLGLYMARELCLNNHAVLDYEYRNDDTVILDFTPGGRFVINFSTSEKT